MVHAHVFVNDRAAGVASKVIFIEQISAGAVAGMLSDGFFFWAGSCCASSDAEFFRFFDGSSSGFGMVTRL